jgi:exodeoxyribonuclease V beta subunit
MAPTMRAGPARRGAPRQVATMTESVVATRIDVPGEDTRDLGLRLPLRGIQLIEASAGTGKTFTVATIYARLVIALGLPVPSLLAVTYTEAATKELRAQLRERLVLARDLLEDAAQRASADDDAPSAVHPAAAALAAQPGESARVLLTRALLREGAARDGLPALRRRLRMAVEQMDLAPIFTIHGFCQRALAEHALEAGQPLAPRELVQNEKALLREVADAFWRQRSRAPADAAALLAVWTSPAQLADNLPALMALDALSPGDPDATALQAAADEAQARLEQARGALARAFAAHGADARALLRESLARGWVNKTVSRDSSVDPVWAALAAWHVAADGRDPPAEPARIANYGARKLKAKTNAKGGTPSSPLFDAIDAWAD